MNDVRLDFVANARIRIHTCILACSTNYTSCLCVEDVSCGNCCTEMKKRIKKNNKTSETGQIWRLSFSLHIFKIEKYRHVCLSTTTHTTPWHEETARYATPCKHIKWWAIKLILFGSWVARNGFYIYRLQERSCRREERSGAEKRWDKEWREQRR